MADSIEKLLNEKTLNRSISFLTETDVLPTDYYIPTKAQNTLTEINAVVRDIVDDTDLYSTVAGEYSVIEEKSWNSISEWKPVVRSDIARFTLSPSITREPMPVDNDVKDPIEDHVLRKVPNFEQVLEERKVTESVAGDVGIGEEELDSITSEIVLEDQGSIGDDSTELARPDSVTSTLKEEFLIEVPDTKALPLEPIDYMELLEPVDPVEEVNDLDEPAEFKEIEAEQPTHFCAYCLGISTIPCILPPRPMKSYQRFMHGLF